MWDIWVKLRRRLLLAECRLGVGLEALGIAWARSAVRRLGRLHEAARRRGKFSEKFPGPCE